MAKSIRSKRKRMLRAIKRERYSKKELERLKTMLEKAKEGDGDADVKFVTVDSLKASAEDAVAEDKTDAEQIDDDLEPMDVNVTKKDPKKRQTFPVWYSHRKIKKIQQAKKRKAKQRAKITREAQRARRRH